MKIAKDNNKIVGIINGHYYYDEVHIGDFIVLEEYRNQHIGTLLIRKVEELFKNKDFDNYNLTTYEFQAPKFYEKFGFIKRIDADLGHGMILTDN